MVAIGQEVTKMDRGKEAERAMTEKGLELSTEAFQWLYDLVETTLKRGLTSRPTFSITEAIWVDLQRYNLIKRSCGNDGDHAWDGSVRLDESLVAEVMKGINLYGIIRSIIYERSLAEADNRKKG